MIWEVELVSFEKVRDWTDLDMDAVLQETVKIREQGNRLFKQGKYKFAKEKYQRVSAHPFVFVLFLCSRVRFRFAFLIEARRLKQGKFKSAKDKRIRGLAHNLFSASFTFRPSFCSFSRLVFQPPHKKRQGQVTAGERTVSFSFPLLVVLPFALNFALVWFSL